MGTLCVCKTRHKNSEERDLWKTWARHLHLSHQLWFNFELLKLLMGQQDQLGAWFVADQAVNEFELLTEEVKNALENVRRTASYLKKVCFFVFFFFGVCVCVSHCVCHCVYERYTFFFFFFVLVWDDLGWNCS